MSHIKEYRCLRKMRKTEGERLALSANFTANFELENLTQEKALFWRFHFKANRKIISSSIKRY